MMGWLGWTVTGIIIWSVGFIFTMSLMKVASDSDDTLLGVRQYETN
jgi:hypothetical protein